MAAHAQDESEFWHLAHVCFTLLSLLYFYIAGLPTTQIPGKIGPVDVNIQILNLLGFAPQYGLRQAKVYLIAYAKIYLIA